MECENFCFAEVHMTCTQHHTYVMYTFIHSWNPLNSFSIKIEWKNKRTNAEILHHNYTYGKIEVENTNNIGEMCKYSIWIVGLHEFVFLFLSRNIHPNKCHFVLHPAYFNASETTAALLSIINNKKYELAMWQRCT